MKEWPTPNNILNLKSLSGGMNFYRKSNHCYSYIAHLLSQISNQKTLHLTFKAHQAFENLKDPLCSALVLTLPDSQQPLEIKTDASQNVIGVVLEQGGHTVEYHSETLSQAKLNYNTYGKEFHIVMQVLEQ